MLTKLCRLKLWGLVTMTQWRRVPYIKNV